MLTIRDNGQSRQRPQICDRRGKCVLSLHLFAVGGDDETTEGFVELGVAVGRRFVPLVQPLVVLNRIAQVGIGFCGCFLDELKRMALRLGNRLRIPVLRAVRDNLLTETVGEIETMAIRRQYARIRFELLV